MTGQHTKGPWRWEVNRKSKSVHLCGGVPRFDLTVIDFVRWGTGGASLRLREDKAGLNIMERPDQRDGWVVPIVGREHHADWCAALDHPDAHLIAAAPDMLAALKAAREALEELACEDCGCEGSNPACRVLDDVDAAIAAAKGGAR